MTAAKQGGWLKAVLGTIGGLLSGAVVMWVSPLLDKAVRPAKPVANFAVQAEGLHVTFHNRSTGGSQARWDFGDGSPLEFTKPDQLEVSHAFAKPGAYVVKLVVTNVINEENERSITVEVGELAKKPSVLEKPQVVDLRVRPPGKVGEPIYAPATFQFQATVDNAEHFVWDFGDGQGIQLADFQVAHTYDKPGNYRVKLAAFNGKEKAVEETSIAVLPAPSGALNLVMLIRDEGVEVTQNRRQENVSKTVRVGKKGPDALEMSIPASTGCEIVAVEKNSSQNENLQRTDWKVAKDRKSVRLVAPIVKAPGTYDAILNERLVVVEERRQRVSRELGPLTNVVAAPGVTTLRLPSIPSEWTDVQRRVTYELRNGERIVWQGSAPPQRVAVSSGGKNMDLSITQKDAGIEVSLTPRK